MKWIPTCGAMIFIVFFMFSCGKDPVTTSTDISAVTGKWNIINDSGYAGVASNNHAVNYKGQKGDYFDFRTDGSLYIKEGGVSSNSTYAITSDTTITINIFPGTIQVMDFTGHYLTITAPFAFTPGGTFGRKVQLYR